MLKYVDGYIPEKQICLIIFDENSRILEAYHDVSSKSVNVESLPWDEMNLKIGHKNVTVESIGNLIHHFFCPEHFLHVEHLPSTPQILRLLKC